MKDKAKKLIERFIEGEKNLYPKLVPLLEKYKDEDNDHINFLRALENDENEKMFKLKAKIKVKLSSHFKPSFDKKRR